MSEPVILPQMLPVQSVHMKEVGYDFDVHALFIRFANGGVYRYADVPELTYHALMVSPSKGKFFHAQIRGKFTEQVMEFPF